MNQQVYEIDDFYKTSVGRYALEWERSHFDRMVSDCFGFHALQIGATSIDFLQNNRIATKIHGDLQIRPLRDGVLENAHRVQLSFEQLPFESECFDLVVLPHTLETAEDPRALLSEVCRVLIPNGRLLITGFNPISLWGLRNKFSLISHSPLLSGRRWISVFQVKEWLQKFSLRLDRGNFGAYQAAGSAGKGFRHAWMEKAGDRWWPQCGALYALGAHKEVAGSALVGKIDCRPYFGFNKSIGSATHRESK